jgi:hypothetical protein
MMGYIYIENGKQVRVDSNRQRLFFKPTFHPDILALLREYGYLLYNTYFN